MNKDRLVRTTKNTKKSAQSSHFSSGACSGRIVTHYGKQLEVEILEGPLAGTIQRSHQRAGIKSLVTGDLVLWEPDSLETGIVVSQQARNNVFGRYDASGNFKPLASNLDCVMIVFAAIPKAFMNLIDRYLVAISNLQLNVFLVLNKMDLTNNAEDQSLQRMLQIYDGLGYPILRVSAKNGEGIRILEEKLSGQTTVLVGQSGVGKSSLINRLGSHELAKVGNLSQSKYKGTHTTTTSRLYHLKNFDLIDSPGIREFGLTKVTRQEVVRGFPEIQSLATSCKFRDCSHSGEPSCAIRDGIRKGVISEERFDSYQNILGTLD